MGVYANSINRVDVEASVFQHENMEYHCGEYEAFLYGGDTSGEAVFRVSLEWFDIHHCNKKLFVDQFIERFLKNKPGLAHHYHEGNFPIIFNFTGSGGFELTN